MFCNCLIVGEVQYSPPSTICLDLGEEATEAFGVAVADSSGTEPRALPLTCLGSGVPFGVTSSSSRTTSEFDADGLAVLSSALLSKLTRLCGAWSCSLVASICFCLGVLSPNRSVLRLRSILSFLPEPNEPLPLPRSREDWPAAGVRSKECPSGASPRRLEVEKLLESLPESEEPRAPEGRRRPAAPGVRFWEPGAGLL